MFGRSGPVFLRVFICFLAISMAGGEIVPSAQAIVSESTEVIRGKDAVTETAVIKEGYIIGPGDVLEVSVWKDEALTKSCIVRPDGGISFPLIGDVKAAGRTASQVREEIKNRISRYVPGAVLSLGIAQVNSMIVYVIGKVNTPGRIVLNCDVDVLQALASAGGLNIFAKRNSIKIFRHGKNDTTILPFEYDKVIDGKLPEQNIRLKRGDVIVVP